MFESIRDAFRELLQQHPDPDTRRDAIAQMRETLVRARVGVQDLQRALEDTERSVVKEKSALETVRRRRMLAEKIGDTETVLLAERYETQHAERVSVLERKVLVQRDELAIVEREVSEMTSDFKLASKGGIPGLGNAPSSAASGSMGTDAGPDLDSDTTLRDFDEMNSRRSRADREARADDMLEALKRRMGK
ncbi:MAG TPA: hypothetical protein VKZ41_08835 [Gemmatimonadales bacterium]|nr:hypothetical protein [Gemmatimonadales bacterium]